MNEVLVSVIIPVFNAEAYLAQCLDSIRKQAYRSLQIIFVDDGSTDRSMEMLERYKTEDSRISVITGSHAGVSAARNAGLAQATGEFCMFVDADDWLEPDAIERLMSVNLDLSTDLLIGAYSRCIQNGATVTNVPVRCFEMDREITSNELLRYLRAYAEQPNRYPLFVTCWGRLFRRSMIGSFGLAFDETLGTFEDVDFNFRFLAHQPKIRYVATPIYNYREETTRITASHSAVRGPEKLFGFLTALDSLEEVFNAAGQEAASTKTMLRHTRSAYTSITLVRLCRQMDRGNYRLLKQFVDRLLNSPWLREALKDYDVRKAKGSVLIQALMTLRLTTLLMFFARAKARRRYGRPQ